MFGTLRRLANHVMTFCAAIAARPVIPDLVAVAAWAGNYSNGCAPGTGGIPQNSNIPCPASFGRSHRVKGARSASQDERSNRRKAAR